MKNNLLTSGSKATLKCDMDRTCGLSLDLLGPSQPNEPG